MCPIAIPGYTTGGLTCPVGTYAKEGSFDCELCKPGMDCSVTTDRGDSGSACVPSQYQLGGSPACKACPKNYECPFGETIARCPIFSYSLAGERMCKPCPDGQDCQDSVPAPCPNNVCAVSQSDDPVDCIVGYYSMPLTMTCTPCPKGHYCAAKSTTPTKCAAGKYAPEGVGTCTACPDEYYSKEGAEYCSPIPPGYYLDTAKALTVCPHKTFSRWGETTCSTCPDGFLCPQQSGYGYVWQHSCPRGSWCKAGVQTKCPAGTFGSMERGKDASVCVDCPPGYNCYEGTANFELVPCPKGGYCPSGKSVIACPAGTFNDDLYGKSLADCKTCPIGHTCSSETKDGGTLCAEGYYCPRGAGAISYPCPAGTHGNSQTGKKDMNECLPCPPGHYCPEGSASPTKAPKGYFTPLSGMPSLESLYLCPPKHYCDQEGMVTYKGNFCQAGYVCPAGSKSAQEVACPEGTFSDRRDLHDTKHCEICPQGYSCTSASTSTNNKITSCPQHRYCPEGTKTSKIPLCPPGTYAPFTNAKSQYDCLPCPPGSYCEGTETSGTANGPTDCPKGYFCPPGTKYAD